MAAQKTTPTYALYFAGSQFLQLVIIIMAMIDFTNKMHNLSLERGKNELDDFTKCVDSLGGNETAYRTACSELCKSSYNTGDCSMTSSEGYELITVNVRYHAWTVFSYCLFHVAAFIFSAVASRGSRDNINAQFPRYAAIAKYFNNPLVPLYLIFQLIITALTAVIVGSENNGESDENKPCHAKCAGCEVYVRGAEPVIFFDTFDILTLMLIWQSIAIGVPLVLECMFSGMKKLGVVSDNQYCGCTLVFGNAATEDGAHVNEITEKTALFNKDSTSNPAYDPSSVA